MSTPSYHLYVDDSGPRYVDHPSTPRQDGMDYFAMGGLLIKGEEVEATAADLEGVRLKHGIEVPFHSSKMRTKKKGWAWLGTDRSRAENLYADLTKFLCSLNGHATACVVHRPGYMARYSHYAVHERWQLCKSAYAILVERAAKVAARDGRKLRVYVEETGSKEDDAIKEYHQALRAGGMIFNPETSGKYNPMKAEAFREALLQNPNFFDKSLLMGQVADLLLYPLVKGRYDESYRPYRELKEAARIIDATLPEEASGLGVKYYCFDKV